MSQTFNTSLLYALSKSAGTDLSWNYCNSLAEQKDAAERAGNQRLVEAIQRSSQSGERLNYRIADLTDVVTRQASEQESRDREISSELHSICQEQELTNQLLDDMRSSLTSALGGLAKDMQDGFRAVEHSVREEGALTREHMSRVSAEDREFRRLENCYTYRAVKLLVQEKTAKALLAMQAEHRAIGKQLKEVWSNVFERYVDEFNQLADAAEDLALATAQNRAKEIDLELQVLAKLQDQALTAAEAPVTGIFGRGKQKEVKAAATGRLAELRGQEARLREMRKSLEPHFVIQSSSRPEQRRPIVEQARRKTIAAFLSTELGRALFDTKGTPLMRMPSFTLTIPEVEFDVCRALEDTGALEYPGIGRIPSKQETLQRVIELSRLAGELEYVDVDALRNPEEPLHLSVLRTDFFEPLDQMSSEEMFRSRRDYERAQAKTENAKWVNEDTILNGDQWSTDEEIFEAAKALAKELGKV